MAASMALRRISLVHSRVLARSGNGHEAISCTQCRFKSGNKKSQKVLPIKIEKPKQSEKFLQKRPIHSIYMVKDYPTQYHPFEECANMHKEAAQPWMLDSMEKLLYASIDLDLTTKKQTKFMADVRGVVVMPNKFDTGHEMSIAVISENEEDLKQAEELGASTVGDETFAKQVIQGLFDREDIRDTDFFICTRRLASSMNTTRNKLQHKTPSAKNDTVGPNVIELLQHHLDGVMYESVKKSQSQAKVRIPIGRIHMDNKLLEENFKAVYLHFARMKPANLTPHVEEVNLVAPPSLEAFPVQLDEYYELFKTEKKPTKAAKEEKEEQEEDADE